MNFEFEKDNYGKNGYKSEDRPQDKKFDDDNKREKCDKKHEINKCEKKVVVEIYCDKGDTCIEIKVKDR